jgi:hypothetical protein
VCRFATAERLFTTTSTAQTWDFSRSIIGASVGSPRWPAARTSTSVDRFRAAQQINPACGCYYDNVYWITFAGMATTDDPRYVIGVMMDNPATNADGTPGHSAAPLFHNIAGWLLQFEG